MTASDESEAAEKAKMRRVLAIFGPAVFSGAFATRVTDPTVAEIAGEFSITAAEAALLGTAYTLPFALVQPILGPVADSIGKRRIVMICVALLGIMLLAAAVALIKTVLRLQVLLWEDAAVQLLPGERKPQVVPVMVLNTQAVLAVARVAKVAVVVALATTAVAVVIQMVLQMVAVVVARVTSMQPVDH